MKTQDILILITLVIGVVNLGIGFANLFLAYKNRRNSLREHVYKEQLIFFHKLSYEISVIYSHFEDIYVDQSISEEKDIAIEKKIEAIHQLVDTHDFLISNSVYFPIDSIVRIIDNLFLQALKQGGKITESELDKLSDSQIFLMDKIREFAGIDELTKENNELTNRISWKVKLKQLSSTTK
jgi:hypothetical protein